MLKVSFVTNIDFYRLRQFVDYLPFRPQKGDKIPFIGQNAYYGKYPMLEITDIKCIFNSKGTFEKFECYLDFPKDCNHEVIAKILNHMEI